MYIYMIYVLNETLNLVTLDVITLYYHLDEGRDELLKPGVSVRNCRMFLRQQSEALPLEYSPQLPHVELVILS